MGGPVIIYAALDFVGSHNSYPASSSTPLSIGTYTFGRKYLDYREVGGDVYEFNVASVSLTEPPDLGSATVSFDGRTMLKWVQLSVPDNLVIPPELLGGGGDDDFFVVDGEGYGGRWTDHWIDSDGLIHYFPQTGVYAELRSTANTVMLAALDIALSRWNDPRAREIFNAFADVLERNSTLQDVLNNTHRKAFEALEYGMGEDNGLSPEEMNAKLDETLWQAQREANAAFIQMTTDTAVSALLEGAPRWVSAIISAAASKAIVAGVYDSRHGGDGNIGREVLLGNQTQRFATQYFAGEDFQGDAFVVGSIKDDDISTDGYFTYRTYTGDGQDSFYAGSRGGFADLGRGNDRGNGSTGPDRFSGGEDNDELTTFEGDDWLDGGRGARDTLRGGEDNDTYNLWDIFDRVIELIGEGIDKITTSEVSVDLNRAPRAAAFANQDTGNTVYAANVENVELSGSLNLSVRGNSSVNDLVGNAGANVIDGLAGNDRITGDGGTRDFILSLQDLFYNDIDGDSSGGVMAAGGGFAAFISDVTTGGEAGSSDAVMVYDMAKGRVITDFSDSGSQYDAGNIAMTADGHTLVFDLAIDGGPRDIYILTQHNYERTGSESSGRLSHFMGTAEANGDSWNAAISADGRYVAFTSLATNLADGDGNFASDIYLADRQAGTITLVSQGAEGTESFADADNAAFILNDTAIAFASESEMLVAEDGNGRADIFIRDIATGGLTRIEADHLTADDLTFSFSASGKIVAFSSYSETLAGGDDNFATDIFVHDTTTGITERVSTGLNGAFANGHSFDPQVSANGRYVLFSSTASNLAIGDENTATPWYTDVYLKDLRTGDVQLISQDGQGRAIGGTGASFTADGRSIVYTALTDLASLGDNDGASDVVVVGLPAGGNDTLRGGSGNDVIRGGAGNDRLRGDNGDDRMSGGRGTDTMVGGDGDDTFIFSNYGDFGQQGRWDRIRDFGAGDLIDLSSLDADLSTEAKDSFTFVADGAASAPGEISYDSTTGRLMLMSGSTAVAEPLVILLRPGLTITAESFLL